MGEESQPNHTMWYACVMYDGMEGEHAVVFVQTKNIEEVEKLAIIAVEEEYSEADEEDEREWECLAWRVIPVDLVIVK